MKRFSLVLWVVLTLLAGSSQSESATLSIGVVWQNGYDPPILFTLEGFYRRTPGDPVEYTSVCIDAEGDLGSGAQLFFNNNFNNPRPFGSCNVTSLTFGGALPVALVTSYGEGVHSATLVARVNGTGQEVARATYTVNVLAPPPPDPVRTLRVRAALGGDGPAPTQGVLLPQEAHVPLGAVVRFEAIDDNGEPLPSSFSLSSTVVDEGVMDRPLFGSSVLLPFLDSTFDSKFYQAVHRGSVLVTVAPLDSTIAAGQLVVVVENPQALGGTFNDLDQELSDAGHRSGIPPQFLKAHADKESTAQFDRLAYRYEPIGGDTGDLTAVSREENFRTLPPYSAYRLATKADIRNGALSAGALLTAADVDPRNRYFIGCGTDGQGGVNIQSSDVEVSAGEIFRCNNLTHGRQNWARSRALLARAESLESEPFTAQTGLAASFGLLQMTYVTAIDQMKWTGDRDGRRNPSLLFDSLENHDRGAGSLDVGVAKVVADFRLRNPAALWAQFGSADRMVVAFARAWSRYNRYEEGYGGSVATRIVRYPIVPRSSIFGGPP
jgi:hypothetical protein